MTLEVSSLGLLNLIMIGLNMYPQAVLSFTLPDGEKKSVPLRPNEPVLIGRNRASTIKLNLPSVSRQHAKIVFERDVFWIEDLGSSNGTFVNQKQVQKARINIGDVLKCGDFVIAVRNHSDRSSMNPVHQHDTHHIHIFVHIHSIYHSCNYYHPMDNPVV